MVNEAPTSNTQVSGGGEEGLQVGNKIGCRVETGMVKDLLDGNAEDLEVLVRRFRQLVSCKKHSINNIRTVIQSGCLKKFVELLQLDDCGEVQNESAWVLCNVAAGSNDDTQAVLDAGALPDLVRLMAPQFSSARLSATWAIMNIACSTTDARKQLLAYNALKFLCIMLKDETTAVGLIEISTRAVCNLCRAGATLSELVPCLALLIKLVSHSNHEVSRLACWAIANVGHIYGQLLLSYLPPGFTHTLSQLQKQHPQRPTLQKLIDVLEKMQPDGDRNSKAVTVYEAANHSSTKRKRKSPAPGGVSTRNSPKRMRVIGPTESDMPCKSWIRTRARARQQLLRVPDQTVHCSTHHKEELWSSVEAGDVARVAQLVQVTGPAVTRGSSGCTLLHVAAVSNQPEVVEWLLQVLSPNLVNKAGLTPAHLAAMRGHTQVLRLLQTDPHLDHLAYDPAGNTYHHWLCVPLFEAVMRGDKKKVMQLVAVGADPDMDGGRVVGGALVRELGVTTARQLATALHMDNIFPCITKTRPHQQTQPHQQPQHKNSDPFTTSTGEAHTRHFSQLPVDSLGVQVEPAPDAVVKQPVGRDVYGGNGAYITILNYTSFSGRPDLHLPNSRTGTHNLAKVFKKMGFNGNIHQDLTEQQTRQVMSRVRDMAELEDVGCAIFVVASHGTPDHQFLTSDGHLMHSRWLCSLFRDSQCSRLKNKPKFFIFDLCCGLYRQDGEKWSGDEASRVAEPLRDTVCLYSNSGELAWYRPSKESTAFTKSLCYSLAHHGHQEFADLYRHFYTHYTSLLPSASPHLQYVGLTKKFFFCSTPSSH